MSSYITNITLLILSIIIYKQLRSYLSHRAFLAYAKRNGCEEPPTLPNKLPYGIERYKPMFTGIKGIDFLETVIRARHLKHGPTVRLHSLKGPMTSTASPQNIQTILATSFQDYELGTARRGNLGDLIGHGIFTADGAKWSHFRQMLKPQFTRGQVSDLEAAERHLGVLWRALPEENEGVVEVDLQPLFLRWTLDTSTEFLFGESVDSQSSALYARDSANFTDEKGQMEFAEAMNSAQETIMYRLRLGNLYWLHNPESFKKACRIVKDFTGECVDRVLAEGYKPRGGEEKGKFVLLEELAQQTRDRVEIRDQCLHLLLAGRDTTAALLSWCIVLLSRHPLEFQNLRSSILAHFGTTSSPKVELTFESLKSCKPLTHLLHETLRLYPIVPMNSRRAVRDTILPTGGGPEGKSPVAIKKGMAVGYSAYVMHRRRDIWGEDADEFRPSRWEGRKLGWEFVPFSGGARVCIGQQYALNEASFVIVKLLQRYDRIEAVDKGPIVKQLSMTLVPGGGAKVSMHRAEEA